ncbi:MAG: polysaccharide biosynthesis tyrosine autokinase [Gemmatimonadetes bacterium]|nr:polysaccharide biosynthesis tyrosine autokinase [Gemmatimonadota bacterium]
MTENSAHSEPAKAGLARWAPTPRPLQADTSLLDRLNSIYRHRYLIASIFLLVMIGTALKTYSTIPLFSAQAQLIIEDERMAAIAGFGDGTALEPLTDSAPYYQTQYRILTGHELARRVAEKLHLARVPEFTGRGPQPTPVGRLRLMLTDAVRAALPQSAAPPVAASHAHPDLDQLADAFAQRISVKPILESHLVNVTFVATDPQFAAQAANALLEEYVAQNLELRLRTTENSLRWLAGELARQQQKVEDGERALAEYRESHDALSLEDRQNIVVARLNQLNDAVTRAKTNRVQKEALYQQVQALGPTAAPESIPAILQNVYLQSIKTRLADLQREKATLAQRYGDKYPDIIKVNASLEDVSSQLTLEVARAVEAIRSEYRSAIAEERTLVEALEDQKRAAMDLNRKSVGYTVLEREAQSNRQLYETLLQREKELQVANNSRGNNVRVIEQARVPAQPFAPNPGRALTLAALAGLVLALGLVFAIDHLDDTVKTPEDVRRLKLPLLSLIPAVKGRKAPAVLHSAVDPFGEAFRALRTTLALSAAEGKRVILITSAQPLEGKTTTACNVARTLAHGGARVLLVDADMRRPGVHANFSLDNAHGLSDVLTGRAPAHRVVHRLADPNLWIMTAGQTPTNPSELLASLRMSALMANARSGPFEWVIVDTPPVLAVTDPLILTPWVSGVVLVLGSEMTTRHHVDRVLETLAPSRPSLLGVVLNRVDLVRNKYYYSRYYGTTYKKYMQAAA